MMPNQVVAYAALGNLHLESIGERLEGQCISFRLIVAYASYCWYYIFGLSHKLPVMKFD